MRELISSRIAAFYTMGKTRNTRSKGGKPVALRAPRKSKSDKRADLILSASPLPVPKELEGYALEEWNRVIPMLVAAHVVQASDYTACLNYCRAVAHWEKAEREYKALGEPLVADTRAGVREHPLIGVVRRASVRVAQLGADLGLTPSSRGRMAVPIVEQDPADEFL